MLFHNYFFRTEKRRWIIFNNRSVNDQATSKKIGNVGTYSHTIQSTGFREAA